MHNLKLPEVSWGFYLRNRSRKKDKKRGHFAALKRCKMSIAKASGRLVVHLVPISKMFVYEV